MAASKQVFCSLSRATQGKPVPTESPDTVSFDDDKLILVDREDREVGSETKLSCHHSAGIRHRAFSVFIFDDDNRLLLQKRSSQKLLWPSFWTNSCCSHPRRGETTESAATRRVAEELGMYSEFRYVYKFEYQASFEDVGSEFEVCSVFVGRCSDDVRVNENEIADWRYITPEALTDEIASTPDRFTPWFQMEWATLNSDHPEAIQF